MSDSVSYIAYYSIPILKRAQYKYIPMTKRPLFSSVFYRSKNIAGSKTPPTRLGYLFIYFIYDCVNGCKIFGCEVE